MDAELEMLVEQLKEGSAEDRGVAAEKLFNKAAEDESARQKAAAIGVIQPLVSCTTRCLRQPMPRNIFVLLHPVCLSHKTCSGPDFAVCPAHLVTSFGCLLFIVFAQQNR